MGIRVGPYRIGVRRLHLGAQEFYVLDSVSDPAGPAALGLAPFKLVPVRRGKVTCGCQLEQAAGTCVVQLALQGYWRRQAVYLRRKEQWQLN